MKTICVVSYIYLMTRSFLALGYEMLHSRMNPCRLSLRIAFNENRSALNVVEIIN